MRKITVALLFTSIILNSAHAQQSNWNEKDREYLLGNLTRSIDLIVKETKNLSDAQWNFKEAADRWSIKEVVEHVALFELLYQREIVSALNAGPNPELATTSKPDSNYIGFIMEEKPHVTTATTGPFTYSVPMGLNEGKNNVAWLLKMRNESIDFIKNAKQDLRLHSLKPGRPNLHQVYIYVFGHTDRHLRQILKIKQHPNYPK